MSERDPAQSAAPERITVLVAGHRPDRLAEQAVPVVADALSAVLAAVVAAAGAACAPVVLTGVAEGSDTITAEVAATLGLPLELLAPGCPEPLSAAQQRAGNTVWLGAPDPLADGDEAIAIRDEIALGFADLLVVVWDGQAPHGLSGGTVRLAVRAALMMMPTVWVDLTGAVCVLDRARLTPELLRRLGAPHPEVGWLREVFGVPSSGEALVSRLGSEISLVRDPRRAVRLVPPKHTKSHQSKQSAEKELKLDEGDKRRLDCYMSPPKPLPHRARAGKLHALMIGLITADKNDVKRSFRVLSTDAYWGEVKPDPDAPHPIAAAEHLERRFKAADLAATFASGRHRDATWWIYGAAATAVFAAVAGAIHLWPGRHGPFWSLLEFAVIGLIVGLFLMSRKEHWHERWIGQRFIAEQLRYARMCLPALATPHLFYAPAWRVTDDRFELESPELWFIQRTLRRQGLPIAVDGAEFLAARAEVIKQFQTYVASVVEGQRTYHDERAEKLETAHHRLHTLSIALFVATALSVPAHFLLHANWLLLFSAFFPALAAAIHGLATKLEIARLAAQHEATAEELGEIVTAVNALDTSAQSDWSVWLRLRDLARVAAAAMSDENDQWRQLIGHQDTELPA